MSANGSSSAKLLLDLRKMISEHNVVDDIKPKMREGKLLPARKGNALQRESCEF